MNRPTDRMPLLAGLAAGRANLVPGILIQVVMLALVAAYYYHAPTRHALDALAAWKKAYGYRFTFVLLGLAGGVLPEILRIAIFQRGTVRRANFHDMMFGFALWGLIGCCTDAFYRFQAILFGTRVNVAMLTKKVAVDMLIYTPLWGTPAVVWMHAWRQSGFSPHVGRFSRRDFIGPRFFPP